MGHRQSRPRAFGDATANLQYYSQPSSPRVTLLKFGLGYLAFRRYKVMPLLLGGTVRQYMSSNIADG